MEILTSKNVLVVYDNFLIGGIQRLMLDQCYEMNSLGYKSEILILSEAPNESIPTFEKREQSLIQQYGAKISYLPGSKLKQLIYILKLIKSNSYDYVFAHSLRGGVLVWVSRLILRKRVSISTVIHQLPSLSAPSQRRKRYFYSRFTDNLLIFSESARKDWNYYLHKNLPMRIIAGSKQIKTCRNGVFLPRLSECTKDLIPNSYFIRRLIFIGRLKEWKGIDTFLELAQNPKLKDFEILIVTPTDPSKFIEKLDAGFQKRITCVVGKSISEIGFKTNDIHLYPANYGPESLYTEGVSINVLEMACLGVTSLITFGGGETWPELVKLGLVVEVNWSNPKSVVEIINSEANLEKNLEVGLARKIIDIKNNIAHMISTG